MKKYAAKVLSVIYDKKKPPRMIRGLEVIININAPNHKKAVEKIIQISRDKDGEVKINNKLICHKFIGILDIQEHGSECTQEEVWYHVVRMKNNKKRIMRDVISFTEAIDILDGKFSPIAKDNFP